MTSKNIVLVGFMGTGKTSVGKILAEKLKIRLVDVDRTIEKAQAESIPEIFEKHGEPYFRELEKKAIAEVSKESGVVITTGGGAVLDPANVEALKKNGWIIALLAKPETVFERVRRSRQRPLLKGKDRLQEIRRLMTSRKPFYERFDLQFETDRRDPVQVAEAILDTLKGKL